MGTKTLASSSGLYLPLSANQKVIGVLGIQPDDTLQFRAPEQVHSLEAFVNQTALAIERAMLAEAAENARVRIETEQLRSSLLSSVSRDLRTPLAAITGSASTLRNTGIALDETTRRELIDSIHKEAARLNRLVNNLLDMTRLESGPQHNRVIAQKDWGAVEEVIGSALARLSEQIGQREVQTHVPPDLPPVPYDAVLIEQVLINLIENALKYSPAESPISVSAWKVKRGVIEGLAQHDHIILEVADHGVGIKPGDETRIFEKFYRSDIAQQVASGAGLGLAICRAIVLAHGGQISVKNRSGGGAAFQFALPIEGQAPVVELH